MKAAANVKWKLFRSGGSLGVVVLDMGEAVGDLASASPCDVDFFEVSVGVHEGPDMPVEVDDVVVASTMAHRGSARSAVGPENIDAQHFF